MQLTQEEDIKVLYSLFGMVGSLVGMVLTDEAITKEDVGKLSEALNLVDSRMRTLEGKTNA